MDNHLRKNREHTISSIFLVNLESNVQWTSNELGQVTKLSISNSSRFVRIPTNRNILQSLPATGGNEGTPIMLDLVFT